MLNSNDYVLIAIPFEWKTNIIKILSDYSVSLVNAETYVDALQIAQSKSLSAVVTVSSWLMNHNSDDTQMTELGRTLKDRTPTIVLIENMENYEWFDILYQPNFCEYATIPLDKEELELLLRRIGILR